MSLDEAEDELRKEMWLAGKSIREIAEARGKTDNAIREWAKRKGLKETRETEEAKRKELFRSLWEKGYSQREITQKTGTAHETLKKWIEEEKKGREKDVSYGVSIFIPSIYRREIILQCESTEEAKEAVRFIKSMAKELAPRATAMSGGTGE